jgi:hypothetical protein
VDWHLDWAASQFLSKQVQIGIVYYVHRQLTGDIGSGAVLGAFQSHVASVGAQFSYIFLRTPAGI